MARGGRSRHGSGSARVSPRSRGGSLGALKRRDARVVAREDPADAIEVVGAKGSRVFGAGGTSWIDFTGGWCVGNLGWAPPSVREAVAEFHGPDYVLPHLMYRPWVELAERLVALAPGRLAKCFRATGGTEAVDFALRMAIAHTGRRTFIALEGAYHGDSIAALAVGEGGDAARGVLRVERLRPPLDAAAAGRLETRLKKRDVAALILEPVAMNLAVLVPDREFMRRAQSACRRAGTLLIADEVACGFGRTGRLFACEHFDLSPDVLCLAKALTSGVAPIGATLATSAVAASMREEGSFYSTYGWHPLSVAAALATLDVWAERGDALLAGVAERSRWFTGRLAEIRFPGRAKIRALGLAIAVELEEEDAVSRIAERARRRGLLVNDDGDALTLFPALDISREEAETGMSILAASV